MIRLIREEKRNEIFSKKLFKTLARLKRSCTFAPASRDTRCGLTETKKQEEHVHRHIELTAVLRETLKQK